MTFNELRMIKDSLPEGSIHRIAESLNVSDETVRNYFGGANYNFGQTVGIHLEKGPSGGVVELDDETILDMALNIINEKS
jgi:transcriptional antiterminator